MEGIVYNSSGSVVAAFTADNKARYSFGISEIGPYYILADKPPYLDSFENIMISENKTRNDIIPGRTYID